MTKLILQDENKAALFSFADCKTTQDAEKQLTARGWSHADALKHIDSAIASGAYKKMESLDVTPQIAANDSLDSSVADSKTAGK